MYSIPPSFTTGVTSCLVRATSRFQKLSPAESALLTGAFCGAIANVNNTKDAISKVQSRPLKAGLTIVAATSGAAIAPIAVGYQALDALQHIFKNQPPK